MTSYPLVIVIAVVLVVLLVRRSALVSGKTACRFLRDGGVIVDVRTPEEFLGEFSASCRNAPGRRWTM